MRRPKLYVYRTRSLLLRERWAWKLTGANGEIIARGEGYTQRSAAEAMGSAVKNGVYSDAVVVVL